MAVPYLVSGRLSLRSLRLPNDFIATSDRASNALNVYAFEYRTSVRIHCNAPGDTVVFASLRRVGSRRSTNTPASLLTRTPGGFTMRFVPSIGYSRFWALLTATALCLSLGLAAPARAQFANTASVEGNVTDESTAALPGVTVTLSSPALQLGQLSDVTNAEGHYRFTQLPLGTYQVRYELSGFQPMVREGLILSQGFAAKVDVSLKIGSVQETITVTGASPIVDVSTTATGTSLSPAQVNNLPSSRMYGDMSRMVSSMRTTSAPNIGRIGFGASGGANAYGNTTTILRLDGVEVLGNTYPDFAT